VAAGGARPGSTKAAPTVPPAAGGAGATATGQPPPASAGVPAAGAYASLDEPPSEVADGRAAGEALAEKYRSGGSTGMGTTRYAARSRVPRDLAPAERPAAGTLFHLLSAEGAYHRQNGRYGSLHELHAAGFLRLDVPVGSDGFRRARYHFTVRVEADGFRAEARPLAAGRAFYVDDNGYILPVE
jgi:hypothetical protein